ncbi:ribosomal protection-like ABC-F family protein [Enterococcus nangangensis]|uniref:ribosomal protection-like ABC-F family protein n=1 Tax=Enterococcus nangangensis TaxID=2559926 RepID=UPI0010F794C2|nr:ABC-F type ribosomal protection protein [Enterococcus nangangensis]
METLTLQLTNIQQNFGAEELLTIPTLTVYQGERIGIVGANGTGKTTLLKIIQGELTPNHGTVKRATNFNYYRQVEQLQKDSSFEDMDWELLQRLAVPKIVHGALSGGEQAKVRLAAVLATYPDGLLLDEPTTHLDQQSVQTIVEELQYYYGTLLFVSHDRFFLDQLATKIWEVADGTVTEYSGNFTAYQEQKKLARLAQVRDVQQYQNEKRRLEQAIQQKKMQAQKSAQVAKKKRQQNIRPDRLASSKQKDTVEKNLHKTAAALTSRLEQLTVTAPVVKERPIIFPKVPELTLHNKFPIRGENFTLKKGQRVLLANCDFQFLLGKKIAIVGANGAGKTSLLQSILQEDPGIVVAQKVVFGTYQQLAYQMTSPLALLPYLLQQTQQTETFLRSILHNLGFSVNDLTKSVESLSGGEATRLQIALLFVRPTNVLLLDEPTNFIDLNTMAALEKLIRAYPGTVLFTTHDTYFVKEVADEVYQLADGKLTYQK